MIDRIYDAPVTAKKKTWKEVLMKKLSPAQRKDEGLFTRGRGDWIGSRRCVSRIFSPVIRRDLGAQSPRAYLLVAMLCAFIFRARITHFSNELLVTDGDRGVAAFVSCGQVKESWRQVRPRRATLSPSLPHNFALHYAGYSLCPSPWRSPFSTNPPLPLSRLIY